MEYKWQSAPLYLGGTLENIRLNFGLCLRCDQNIWWIFKIKKFITVEDTLLIILLILISSHFEYQLSHCSCHFLKHFWKSFVSVFSRCNKNQNKTKQKQQQQTQYCESCYQCSIQWKGRVITSLQCILIHFIHRTGACATFGLSPSQVNV